MPRSIRGLGPGLLVTAAFIGPGTVTTSSRAGAAFGTTLLWAVLFSTLATIVLQEMAARLGLVTRQGLGEAVRNSSSGTVARTLACGLVLLAILFGNAAYQTGNLTGAELGVELLSGRAHAVWVLIISGLAGLLLWTGRYRVIEGVLVSLVVTMTLVFLATAIVVRPPLGVLWRGLLVPTIPDGSTALVIGLIGTTVVPYNLFLHASAVLERWPQDIGVDDALRQCRLDTVLSISLGGLVTAAIVVTGAALQSGGGGGHGSSGGVTSAADMATQLSPLLGSAGARALFGIGLFAAGMTSAVTAPLAAAYATAGVFGWKPALTSWRFRLIWLAVLACGAAAALAWDHSPTQAILVAQVANGLLLPIVAVFLLIAVNQRRRMLGHANGAIANLVGLAVVGTAAALGGYHVLSQLGWLP